MLRDTEKHGYRIALGNCFPFDSEMKNATFIKYYLKVKAAVPGTVIILHDGLDERTFTVDVLKEFLPWIKKKGFEVVTLSELLEAAVVE